MKTEYLVVGAVVFICLILFIPLGLLAAGVIREDPFSPVRGEPVRDAAQRAGISVCRVTDVADSTPGSNGCRLYMISTDCSSPDPGNSVTVYVQEFKTEEARDAAIRGYHSQTIGHTRPGTVVVPYGASLILVRGAHSNEVVRVLFENLRQIKGQNTGQ